MATASSQINFLLPLTLDAKIFLNALKATRQSQEVYLDINLIETLEQIVDEIDKMLTAKRKDVVNTERTKLVPLKEVDDITNVYFCKKCKLELGKSNYKAANHLMNCHEIIPRLKVTKKNREGAQNGNVRAVPYFPLSKKVHALLNGDMVKFFNENLPITEKLKHLLEYETIERELQCLMTPLFPGKSIRINKFGSRITGTATPHSDLDMFVDIGNTASIYEPRASTITIFNLKLVCGALRKCNTRWANVVDISKARVPIVKVCHVETGIECDIGFSNSLGFFNSKLMEHLFDLQPMARRLCIFLKKWLLRTKLSKTITTYSISLMAVYFMQVYKYLPSIKQLQEDPLCGSLCVGPWIPNFVYKTLNDFKMNTLMYKDQEHCNFCLKTFFEFYSKFEFDKYVICPYLGEAVLIKEFVNSMPSRYVNYIINQDDHAMQLTHPMIVQDPMELNHNVTKCVSPTNLKMFKNYCCQSAKSVP